MKQQHIFPVNPMHETTTVNDVKVWVTHYSPNTEYWKGFDASGNAMSWRLNGENAWTPGMSLRTVPDIPPEARSPEIGEVWADSSGRAVLLMQALDLVGGPGWCVAVLNNSCLLMRNECSHNLVPWPKGVPHGFEDFRVAVANKLYRKS